MLARERLKRLWKVALTAPSHECAVILHLCSARQTSDLCCRFCARCSSRPNFSTGGWRPLAQKVAGHRLRLFDMRRGWGKAVHPPPWQRATLATYRARGGQVAPFDGRDHTGPRSCKQTDKSPSHAREKLLNRFMACPVELAGSDSRQMSLTSFAPLPCRSNNAREQDTR